MRDRGGLGVLAAARAAALAVARAAALAAARAAALAAVRAAALAAARAAALAAARAAARAARAAARAAARWELTCPAGPRPELADLWALEMALVTCAQALRRAWRAGLRGRRRRRKPVRTAQKEAGQVRGRPLAPPGRPRA